MHGKVSEMQLINKRILIYKHKRDTLSTTMTTKLLQIMGFEGILNIRMIRYLLLQFVNIADGDMPTKLSNDL